MGCQAMLFHQCLIEWRRATGCQRASPKRQAGGFAQGGRNRPEPPYETACGTIICGITADFGQPGNPLVEAGQGLTCRGIAVVLFMSGRAVAASMSPDSAMTTLEAP